MFVIYIGRLVYWYIGIGIGVDIVVGIAVDTISSIVVAKVIDRYWLDCCFPSTQFTGIIVITSWWSGRRWKSIRSSGIIVIFYQLIL